MLLKRQQRSEIHKPLSGKRGAHHYAAKKAIVDENAARAAITEITAE